MNKKYNVGIILKEPNKCNCCGHVFTRVKAYKDIAGFFWFDCLCKATMFLKPDRVQYCAELKGREVA